MSKAKSNRFIDTRSLFLVINGLAALGITAYQWYRYFTSKALFESPTSPWLGLYFVPFLFGILLILLAIFNQRRVNAIQRWLDKISRNRKVIALIVFGVLTGAIFAISQIVKLDDLLINIGMSGIGLLFYSSVLILLFFILLKGGQSNRFLRDRFLTITLLVISVSWLAISISKFGLEPDLAFWNVAAVPVLWFVLTFVICIILILSNHLEWIKNKYAWLSTPKAQRLIEMFIIVAIWATASIIWTNTPYSNSYFLTAPQSPDGHYWPSSDARLMDLGGQYLIIGGKLETPYFSEKPFYSLFLGLLHFFFGQNYETITNVQIIIFALLPVFIYLLGKIFSNRILGIGLAIFAISKEMNAIFSTYKISVSHSRLMMTEFPTALLLVILTYIMVKWIRTESSSKGYPLLTGILLGIAVFIRTNSVIVVFAVLAFILIILRENIKFGLRQIGIVMVGVLIVIGPWIIYNQINYGRDPLTWKIQEAIRTRFSPNSKIDNGFNSVLIQTESNSLPVYMAENAMLSAESAYYSDNKKPESHFIYNHKDQNVLISQQTKETSFYKSKPSMVLGHFLNNQIKSLFVLPFQIFPARLTYILDQEYWQEPVTWNGDMPAEGIVAFAVNLILIAFGLRFAWRNIGWVGLIPLMIQVAYHFSNALVRTSGSRYLVAVDWVICFYFLLGLWHLLQVLNLIPKEKPHIQVGQPPTHKLFLIVLAMGIIIGLSLPILNISFPRRYNNEKKNQVFERLPISKIKEETPFDEQLLQSYYQSPNSFFLYGRELYPEFGELEEIPAGWAITFTLLTPKQHEIILPYNREVTERIPAGEDFMVFGCRDPRNGMLIGHFGYFVQSDKIILSTAIEPDEICD